MWPALLLAPTFAAPSPEATEAALARVNARVPAMGYVFLLDTSEPMKATADGLRAEIAALAQAVPAGDSLEVIAFHTRPFVAVPRTVVTEAGRAALVARLTTLELPSGYDRDLGAGLSTLATELAAPGGPAFQHVFTVSNFCHAPSVLSPWSMSSRGCGPIKDQHKIGEAAATPMAEGRLSLHWFPVKAGETPVYTAGAATAMKELGGELVTDGVAAWLQNFRARLHATRPQPAAELDAHTATFTATLQTPADAAGHAELALHNTAGVLDLRVDHLVLTGATTSAGESVLLAPDAILPIDLVVPAPPWSLFPRSDTLDVKVTVSGQGHLEPTEALAIWGIEGSRRDLSTTLTVPVQRRYGLPLPAAISVLVGIFFGTGLLSVFIQGKRLPLRLGGVLTARYRGGPRQTLEIADRKEAAIVLGTDGTVRLGAAEESTIILRVRRPLWNLYADVQIRAKGAEINGRPTDPGLHRIIQGATSFRIGDWRIAWE